MTLIPNLQPQLGFPAGGIWLRLILVPAPAALASMLGWVELAVIQLVDRRGPLCASST